MKLVSYLKDGQDQLAVLIDRHLYDTDLLHPDLPSTMGMFLQFWDDMLPLAQAGVEMVRDGRIAANKGISIDIVDLLAPVPYPSSCRDGYAFRQHVAAARRNRKVDMIPEFDQYPIFYMTNHQAVYGPGPVRCMPDHFEKLDFELEAAIVICKGGRNIKAEQADEYIGGLMVMNDLSARRLQLEEMLLNLGPAKGKDFATTVGPWLVTLDELAPFETAPKEGHTGKSWNLHMTCHVNGKQVSEGNLGDMDWTFAELIERASYGVDLHPGDIIGSGTVGTGCFLELNGTGRLSDQAYPEQWLQPEDEVVLEIEGLGKLENRMVAEDEEWSILKLKKGGVTGRKKKRKATFKRFFASVHDEKNNAQKWPFSIAVAGETHSICRMETNVETIGKIILDAAIAVYRELGPGLLEPAYKAALCRELILRGFNVKTEVGVHYWYKGENLGKSYLIDILVNDLVVSRGNKIGR